MLEEPHLEQGSEKPACDENKIQLFNMRFCPFAERTALTLLAKKIPFDNVNINQKKKPEWFLESGGKVPVVVHKGKYIPESLIASDYLDEVFPEPKLNPSDPLQKALDRVVIEKQSAIMRHLYPIFSKIPNQIVTMEEKLQHFENLVAQLETFEEELKNRGTPYLGGQSPVMADYMIWPYFERIEGLPILMGDVGDKFVLPAHLEHLHAWIKAMRSTDAVKAYGFSPKRMATILKIHYETYGYDNALKESSGM